MRSKQGTIGLKKKMAGKLEQFSRLFSDENLVSDRLFYFIFYICAGFLPPVIGILGHRQVQLPLIILSIFIVLRFFMREQCRTRMISGFAFPATILLVLFALLLFVSGGLAVVSHPERMRVLGKPATVILALVFLIYVWTHRDILNRQFILKLVFFGSLAGFSITMIKLIHNYYLGVGYSYKIHAGDQLYVDLSINNELKILMLFVPVAALAFSNRAKQSAVFLGGIATILAVSFFVIGLRRSGDYALMDWIASETVQFGIPLALFVLVLAGFAPRLINNLLFGSMAFVLVTAPWLFQGWFRFLEAYPVLPKMRKLLVRGEVWDGVARKVLEAPLFGYGIDSVRYLNHVEIARKYYIGDTLWHPHNMVLQLWLDLGLAGVLVWLGILYLGWRFAGCIEPSQRPIILAGLTMLSVFMMVSHSIWQTWSMALITFFVALVSLVRVDCVRV